MYVHVPDQHPGRCLNHRRDSGDAYGVKQLRCLEMEGHDGRCRFPAPTPPLDPHYRNWAGSISGPADPQPWVVPE